jgi:hypothetical protein
MRSEAEWRVKKGGEESVTEGCRGFAANVGRNMTDFDSMASLDRFHSISKKGDTIPGRTLMDGRSGASSSRKIALNVSRDFQAVEIGYENISTPSAYCKGKGTYRLEMDEMHPQVRIQLLEQIEMKAIESNLDQCSAQNTENESYIAN